MMWRMRKVTSEWLGSTTQWTPPPVGLVKVLVLAGVWAASAPGRDSRATSAHRNAVEVITPSRGVYRPGTKDLSQTHESAHKQSWANREAFLMRRLSARAREAIFPA